MKRPATHDKLPILIVLLAVSTFTSTARAETPRRASGQWAINAGVGGFLDGDLGGLGGATLAVEHTFSPHAAIGARLLAGAAGGGLLRGLAGWGLAGQLGARVYLFDYPITPYISADLGVSKLQLEPQVGAGQTLADASAQSVAEAARESELRFLATASVGLDLTLKMGLTFALEAQAGGSFGPRPRSIFGSSFRVGYRF